MIIAAYPEIASITVQVSRELELGCAVGGVPTPEVIWTKNNLTLTSTDRLTISFTMEGVSSVRVESASLEDSGVYSCSASNAAGSVNRTVTVKIKDTGRVCKIGDW